MWMSKPRGPVSRSTKAHFVIEGQAACSGRFNANGAPRLPTIAASFVELRSQDHLCSLCRETHPAVCECGACSARKVA